MILSEGTVRYHLSIFQYLGILESIMSVDILYSKDSSELLRSFNYSTLAEIVHLFIQCVIKVQSDISKQIRFFERHAIVKYMSDDFLAV